MTRPLMFFVVCVSIICMAAGNDTVAQNRRDGMLRPMDRRFSPAFSLRFYGSGVIHHERVYTARMRTNGSFGDIEHADAARPYLEHYFSLTRKHDLTRYTDNVCLDRLERLLREAYNLKEDEAFYR